MTVRDIGPRDRGARKSQGIRTVLDHLKEGIVRAPKPSIPNPRHLGRSLRTLHGERSSKVGGARENWINPTLPTTKIQIEAIKDIAEKLLERKARRIKTENPCHLSR
jgi:hypothetical protein